MRNGPRNKNNDLRALKLAHLPRNSIRTSPQAGFSNEKCLGCACASDKQLMHKVMLHAEITSLSRLRSPDQHWAFTVSRSRGRPGVRSRNTAPENRTCKNVWESGARRASGGVARRIEVRRAHRENVEEPLNGRVCLASAVELKRTVGVGTRIRFLGSGAAHETDLVPFFACHVRSGGPRPPAQVRDNLWGDDFRTPRRSGRGAPSRDVILMGHICRCDWRETRSITRRDQIT